MRLREYETVCIFKPYLGEVVAKVEQKIKPHIDGDGGTLLGVKPWGRKKLGYTINKEREGLYVRFHYVANPLHIHEIEKILSYDESVLKYLTIKLGERADIDALKKTGEEDIPDYFRPDRERDSQAYSRSYQDDTR